MIRRRYRSGTEGYPTRRTLADERGYNPEPSDMWPAPEHLKAPAGVEPLAWFAAELRTLRIVGPLTRCAHPHCRTSVTEDTVSFCPHNLPFCEACEHQDGCGECATSSDHKEAS